MRYLRDGVLVLLGLVAARPLPAQPGGDLARVRVRVRVRVPLGCVAYEGGAHAVSRVLARVCAPNPNPNPGVWRTTKVEHMPLVESS